MEHITSAGNTEVPAYLALLREGLRVERHSRGEFEELWVAVQDDLSLSGSSPLEALGLFYVRKQRGKNWKADDPEIDAFLHQFSPQ